MDGRTKLSHAAAIAIPVTFLCISESVGAPISSSDNYTLRQAETIAASGQTQSNSFVVRNQVGMISGESALSSSNYIAKPGVISFGHVHIIFSDRFEG